MVYVIDYYSSLTSEHLVFRIVNCQLVYSVLIASYMYHVAGGSLPSLIDLVYICCISNKKQTSYSYIKISQMMVNITIMMKYAGSRNTSYNVGR